MVGATSGWDVYAVRGCGLSWLDASVSCSVSRCADLALLACTAPRTPALRSELRTLCLCRPLPRVRTHAQATCNTQAAWTRRRRLRALPGGA